MLSDIPATGKHKWSKYTVIKKATVFAQGQENGDIRRTAQRSVHGKSSESSRNCSCKGQSKRNKNRKCRDYSKSRKRASMQNCHGSYYIVEYLKRRLQKCMPAL